MAADVCGAVFAAKYVARSKFNLVIDDPELGFILAINNEDASAPSRPSAGKHHPTYR